MHARIENGLVAEYPIINLRQRLPDTSLPTDLTDNSKLPPGFVYVQLVAAPNFNPATHKAVINTAPTLVNGSWVLEYTVAAKTPDELAADASTLREHVSQSVQDRLDTFAKERGYDGILSACTYATSTVPKFKSEGQYCVNSRDSTWAACYQILADVQAGVRPMPTLEQVLSELPELTWPA